MNLIEGTEKSQDDLFHSKKLIRENIEKFIDKMFRDEEHYKVRYLETLYEVIIGYLDGKVSPEVLNFYLENQFMIEKTKRNKIFSSLNIVFGCPNNGHNIAKFPIDFSYPKVSVIITTYNRKLLLKQAIESFLYQDYPNIEIIVIDDCSNDGTEKMIEDYFQENQSVIYLRNKTNMGPGINRRTAFNAYADGEYTLFFDDDDYLIDMNYISKAVKFHIKHPEVSFVGASTFKEFTQTKEYNLRFLELDGVISGREYFLNFMKPKYRKPDTTTTLFKTKSLIEIEISKMGMVNDTPILLRTLFVGDAGFIDSPVGVYRMHGGNITFNCSPEFIIENLDEKRNIKNIAISDYGYNLKEMSEWFDHNAYSSISYFFKNSAKRYRDFKFINEWTKKNCPNLYKEKLQKESKKIFIRHKISQFTCGIL